MALLFSVERKSVLRRTRARERLARFRGRDWSLLLQTRRASRICSRTPHNPRGAAHDAAPDTRTIPAGRSSPRTARSDWTVCSGQAFGDSRFGAPLAFPPPFFSPLSLAAER